MLTLAVLLQIAGLIVTFAFGVPGYVLGPLTIVAGGVLYRREQRRRKHYAAESQPVPRRAGGQRFLIGLGSVIAAFCALFALVWRLTAGLADTADAFFIAMKTGDLQKAHAYMAEDFRASTTDADLRRFVERSALANYESASWTTRSIENSRGQLIGTVNTRSGGSIPMAIALVRENGEWKILSLHKPEAGLLTDDPRPQPNTHDQTRLVRETTGKFVNAVASHDFTQFHQSAAALWQRQITPQKLAEAFGSFSAAGVDLRGLGAVEPRISSAAFDDDGTFAIAGTYPMGGNTFEYRYRYIFEGTDWKMVGVSAHLR